MSQVQGIYQNLSLGKADDIAKRVREKNRDADDFEKKLDEALEEEKPGPSVKVFSPEEKEARLKKLKDVCIEMESLFVARMLKEMRKTVHKNEMINGGFAEEVFEDMLYDEYALNISKTANLGLANMLYNEMSKKLR